MWVSQVWSLHHTCPEGTEQRAALITQGSCCHIVTVRHPMPRYCALQSPPVVVAMTTQTMDLLAQQMQHKWPLKYRKLNLSHCLSDSLFASVCSLLSPCRTHMKTFFVHTGFGHTVPLIRCLITYTSIKIRTCESRDEGDFLSWPFKEHVTLFISTCLFPSAMTALLFKLSAPVALLCYIE